jgi:ribosome-binding protein aMBF1 (putative translation factor)
MHRTEAASSNGGRMNSPQSSRADSPLAEIRLSEYISRLAQETIRYRALSYKELAQQTSIPKPVLQEAIEGELGLRRGQWKMLCQLLGLPTTFQVRASERSGQSCLEAYFPPVSVQLEGNTKQEPY